MPEGIGQDSWSKQLPGIGTYSSPRISDLNKDGVGDIILGAGRMEFESCDTAIFALNGLNGELLWNVSADDQVFGSASLKDLTGDGILDVVINGRSAELQAINGANGNQIWSFDKNSQYKGKKQKWYNFYNPQFVPDQNNDGLEDILVSNGGDVLAEPHDPKRPAGSLCIVSGRDGSLLSMAKMPDGKETYMSVVTIKNRKKGIDVMFGTGGETIGGSLYLTNLNDILKGDISKAIQLVSSPDKGYIGPPVRVNLTKDKISDMVANSVDGRLLAFNGKDNEPMWEAHLDNTEAYSSIAVGHFTDDDVPDFFVSYAQGVFPSLDWAKQMMVNGKTGKIEFVDSLGFLQTTTPVVVDLNADGRDEAILNMNYKVNKDPNGNIYFNALVAFDFSSGKLIWLSEGLPGHNISTTPWVGDIDNNGFLDIVFCHSTNAKTVYMFDGLQINLLKTNIRITGEIKWGAYMGSNYDGIYK